MAGIYMIKNTVNNKVYIGQSKNVHTRLMQHKGYLERGVHGNSHLQHSYNKYGDVFIYKEIVECPICDLDHLEVLFISIFRSCDPNYGYNLTIGGRSISEEQRNLLENGMFITDETRARMSRSQIGRKHSPETLKKMSEHSAWIRPVVCVETKEIFKSAKEAAREKGLNSSGISNCLIKKRKTHGGFHWQYYIEGEPILSPEDFEPPRSKKPVVCVETGEVFKSMQAAADHVGATNTEICSCAKGKQLTCRGFHWAYA